MKIVRQIEDDLLESLGFVEILERPAMKPKGPKVLNDWSRFTNWTYRRAQQKHFYWLLSQFLKECKAQLLITTTTTTNETQQHKTEKAEKMKIVRQIEDEEEMKKNLADLHDP